MKISTAIRRYSMVVLVFVMMLSMAIPCYAAEENAVSDARNGVVRVFAIDPETGNGGSGSGFGIGVAGEETEYFVTNWHVVTCSGEYPVGKLDVYILLTNDAIQFDEQGGHFDPSEMIKCQVVYSADQYPDVAILKAERKVPGRVALPLRSARNISVASSIYALGYPAAADNASISYEQQQYYYYADVDSVHISGGVVSKLDDFEIFGGTYCIEHDANINHGNSGGPLVDDEGNVVGINTYGINAEGSDGFLNYSVYIDYAMDYLNQLGIAYDYVGMEEPFPVVAVVVGGIIVLALLAALLVLKNQKVKRQPVVDTGLRVQFDAGAMMASKRYVINGTLRFGRAVDCNIRYKDNAPGISSHHCEILVNNGQVYIRDLNSSHGTYVNGSRIVSNQEVPLTVGAEVTLGGVKEKFQIVRSTKK